GHCPDARLHICGVGDAGAVAALESNYAVAARAREWRHMGYNTVLYQVSEGVATVTLNRHDKMNAFSDELVIELYDAMRRADADKDARVIVLTGAGRAFSAGGDVSGFSGLSDPRAGLNRITHDFDV